MSNFKIIFLAVFIAAAVAGILVFAGIINIGSSSTTTKIQGTVTVWGTFDNQSIQGFLAEYNLKNQDIIVRYIEKDPATFDRAFVEAVATNSAPDLILIPDNLVWRLQDKLYHIPFGSLPIQTFQTNYISGANAFLVSDGTIAIPWAADPLVMYYNRDLLDAAGIVKPPKTWNEFVGTVPLLAKKQVDLSLTQMAAALGTYKNIAHPKDILALLFIEAGSPFITQNGPLLAVHFGPLATSTEQSGAQQALNFYLGFADPVKQNYTWNAGMPLDRDAFIKSDLAYYFGYASELPQIRAQNPNLNFGIAVPPQSPTGAGVTTGALYGFAIPKSTTPASQTLAFAATRLLTNAASEASLVTKLGTKLTLVPIDRTVLSSKPKDDPYLGFLYDAALIQKTWVDPNPLLSGSIFNTLITDVSSSTLAPDAALTKASAQLDALNGSI